MPSQDDHEENTDFEIMHNDNKTNFTKPEFAKEADLIKLIAKPSGNMVRIKCTSKSNPEPSNITWYKIFKLVYLFICILRQVQRIFYYTIYIFRTKDDINPIIREMGKVKYFKSAIVLEDLIPKDSGKYTCIVCNLYGCITHATELRVKGEKKY